MKNQNNLIVTGLVAVLFAAVGFYAGQQYQLGKTSNGFAGGMMGRNGGGYTQQGSNRTGMSGRSGMRPVSGEIISSDEKSVTVKLMDGSSKIILLSDNTGINKADSATKSDFKVGEKVSIFGTVNSDGSVTATNIQIGALVRGMITPSASPTLKAK